MKRQELINRIIEEQQKVLETLSSSVESYRNASDLDENETSNNDDLGRQGEAKDMQLRLETLLNEAQQNLSYLENQKNSSHNEIENGSLIDLGEIIIFVGVSLQKFTFHHKEIICISDDAPIFNNIQGKTAADSIKIGNTTYTIISVF